MIELNIWEPWVNLCLEAYIVLRRHHSLIVAYAEALFAWRTVKMPDWLAKSMALSAVSEETAAEQFRKKLIAEEAFATKIKNFFHTAKHETFWNAWEKHIVKGV